MEIKKEYFDLLIGLAGVLFLVIQGVFLLRWVRKKQNEKLDVTERMEESEEVTGEQEIWNGPHEEIDLHERIGAHEEVGLHEEVDVHEGVDLNEGVGAHEGVEYRYVYTPASQYVTPGFTITLDAMSTGSFEVRSETRMDRLFKKLGLAAEIQTHDPDFDKDFFVHSGAPEFTTSFLMHTKRRHLIRKILDTGFTSIRHDGKVMEAVWRPFTVKEELGENTISTMAGHLVEISKNMPDVSQMATLKSRASRGVKRAAAFAIPIIMLVAGYPLLYFGGEKYPPLDLREIVVDSLTYSLPALLGFLWLAFLWLKGNSSSHKELLIVTLIALAAFPLFGAGMEITVNGELDKSKPAQHSARVVKKSAVRSQTGVKHYAIVKSWRENRKTEKIAVTSGFYRKARPGRTTVKLQTKKGWLGFEWLVSFEIAKR